jgi:hypothetical protein
VAKQLLTSRRTTSMKWVQKDHMKYKNCQLTSLLSQLKPIHIPWRPTVLLSFYLHLSCLHLAQNYYFI